MQPTCRVQGTERAGMKCVLAAMHRMQVALKAGHVYQAVQSGVVDLHSALIQQALLRKRLGTGAAPNLFHIATSFPGTWLVLLMKAKPGRCLFPLHVLQGLCLFTLLFMYFMYHSLDELRISFNNVAGLCLNIIRTGSFSFELEEYQPPAYLLELY